jgi:cytochrome c551/c552
MKLRQSIADTAAIVASVLMLSLAPSSRAIDLKDVADKIDSKTGKAADTDTEFSVEGIVAARATLPDGTVLAVVQEDGASLPVLLPKGSKVGTRDAVSLSGKLADHAPGLAVLQAAKVDVSGTNKILRPTPHSLAEAKDAATFSGDYVVLTNVTLDVTDPKFTVGKSATLKDAAGTEMKVLVGQSLDGREKPAHPLNLFCAMVKLDDGGWTVLPARFVPADSRQMSLLATKSTCLTCHKADQKLIGPSYQDVAAKYRNDPDALAKIAAQIENGGSGKWGAVPMLPFKGKVPADDIQKLGHWILEMRWDAVLSE